MLTGDKVETAINIGFSAGLLSEDMSIKIFNKTEKEEIIAMQNEVLQTLEDEQDEGSGDEVIKQKKALIVAGEVLTKISDSIELKESFMKITDKMDVVIACRVTPKQKGDIVDMVRERFPDKMTLAVGDGANDVTMINRAHVGVGIAGREGM